MHRFLRGYKGDMLINLIVASVILGTLLMGIITMMSNMNKGAKRMTTKLDIEQLRLYVTGTLACDKTMGGLNSCIPFASSGTFMDIKDNAGNIFISSNPTTPTVIGAFTLRGECAASGDGIVIRAAMVNGSSSPLTETNSGKFMAFGASNVPVTWADNRSLMFAPERNIATNAYEPYRLCKPNNIETRITNLEMQVNGLSGVNSSLTALQTQVNNMQTFINNLVANSNNSNPVYGPRSPYSAINAIDNAGGVSWSNVPGDVNGDRWPDYVVTYREGGSTIFWVGDGYNVKGVLGATFAYDPPTDSGLRFGLSAILLDGDRSGTSSVFTMPGPGGGPRLRVFKLSGGTWNENPFWNGFPVDSVYPTNVMPMNSFNFRGGALLGK